MSLEPYFGYLTVDSYDCPPFIMFNNDDCQISRAIRSEGGFEPTSLRIWCDLVRSATSVLDIGANTGIYSLVAASLRSDIPIHAFEPNPHAFARLRVNKHRNSFSQITEHQEALGHEDGVPITLTWRAKPGHPISSGAVIGNQTFSGEVETSIAVLRRLDKVPLPALGERPAVKIDVEGAELYFFRGASGLLNHRPDILLESFHQKPCDEITAATKPLGYRYFSVDELTGTVTEQPGLVARQKTESSFNQLMTTRNPPI